MTEPLGLHHLWGKAKDHPDYVKSEWIALQGQIERLETELARLRVNSERWEWAKACAVDEDDGGFILYPETAFLDRDYDPDAEAFEAAVDAAIAAERGK